MKKVFLVLFILIDVVVMAGAAVLLYLHLKPRHPADLGLPKVSSAPAGLARPASAPSGPGLLSSPIMSSPGAPPAAPSASGARKILFSYRNPHAKKVAIRADFTGWKADDMQKDSRGVWTYQMSLAPGEYAYVFSIDGKPPFNDPANKHTKRIGTTLVSSILVKPAAPH